MLRFVVKMIPSNSIQFPISGDIGTPPFPHQWKGLELPVNSIALLSEEDTVASFYLVELPACWLPCNALSLLVTAADISDRSPHWAHSPEELSPCLRVPAMGWLSACGLVQYFHRLLCSSPSAPLGVLFPFWQNFAVIGRFRPVFHATFGMSI